MNIVQSLARETQKPVESIWSRGRDERFPRARLRRSETQTNALHPFFHLNHTRQHPSPPPPPAPILRWAPQKSRIGTANGQIINNNNIKKAYIPDYVKRHMLNGCHDNKCNEVWTSRLPFHFGHLQKDIKWGHKMRAVVALMDRALDLYPGVVGLNLGSGRNCPRLRWDPWARHRTPNCSPDVAVSAIHCSRCVCTWMG